MNRFLRLCLFASLCALPSLAQSNTTVTATAVKTAGGGTLASGSLCFYPSAVPSGSGVNSAASYCAAVTAGSVSGFSVPNAATVTTPSNLTYTVQVTDAASSHVVLSVPFVVVSGSSFSWNSYTVPGVAQINGYGAPNVGCATGARYTQQDASLNYNLWTCSSGTWTVGAGPAPSSSPITRGGGGSSTPSISTVSFSATPVFALASGDQTITLTGNVTSSALSGLQQGQYTRFRICQDATGGRTFTWPTAMHGAGVVGSTASTCSAQTFESFDGSTLYATGPMVINQ